jgi:hypothetical protein
MSTKVLPNVTTTSEGLNDADKNIAITDVNLTTNTYTTLFVDIDFMGKTFVSERLRFCDYIAVKNTTGSKFDPRLPGYVAPIVPFNSSPVMNPNSKKRDGREQDSLFLSNENSSGLDSEKEKESYANHFHLPFDETQYMIDNATIGSFFKNETGHLVQCPLYLNDSLLIRYHVNISEQYHHLGSYQVSFTVIDNNGDGEVIGCTQMYVTPIQSKVISDTILYGVIVLLIVTFFVNFFIIIYSSYQESSNPFLYKASTFCNSKLLNQLDTNVSRIIIYLQFALFIGGLDLQYPGFYQPIIGQLKWCALLGTNVFRNHFRHRHHRVEHTSNSRNKEFYDWNENRDNIYMTINSGGIKSLTSFTSDPTSYDIWPNFMFCFAIWLLIQASVQEMFLLFKFASDSFAKHFSKRNPLASDSNFQFLSKNNMYYILGQIFHSFLHLFSFPLLILTTYMFSITASTLHKNWYIPSTRRMSSYTFSFTTPYDDITSRSCNRDRGYNKTHKQNFGRSDFNHSFTCHGPLIHEIPTFQPIVGSIVLATWVALAGYFIFYYLIQIRWLKIVRSKNISKLYTSMRTILLWSYLYHDLHPDKVSYVSLQILLTVIKSVVIGALQNRGFVQVILLVMLSFTDMILLLVVKPYFVKVAWSSSMFWVPLAKLVVTILCIPYIRELNINEAARTYIAYVQLLIHAIVALFFIIKLLYGFFVTLVAIGKNHNNKLKRLDDLTATGKDDFNKNFEFQPLALPHRSSNEKSQLDDDDLIINDQFYYRGNTLLYEGNEDGMLDGDKNEDFSYHQSEHSNKNLRGEEVRVKIQPPITPSADAVSLESFRTQQKISNMRKRSNNYCVREGDNVYYKYFINDSIDPEVKALWEARSVWEDVPTEEKGPIRRTAEGLIPKKFKKQTVESGFQVSRPRKLVVKTLAEIEEQQNQAVEKESEISSTNDFEFNTKT